MVVLLLKSQDLMADVSSFKLDDQVKIMLTVFLKKRSESGDGTDITFEVGSNGDINID